jgi:hypothetical protein
MNSDVVKKWYGARCLFLHSDLGKSKRERTYEERVVVVRAIDFDTAIIEAEKEAENYSSYLQDTEYLGFVDVFEVFSDRITNKTEVFSLMRRSGLTPKKYIDRFYNTSKEVKQK